MAAAEHNAKHELSFNAAMNPHEVAFYSSFAETQRGPTYNSELFLIANETVPNEPE